MLKSVEMPAGRPTEFQPEYIEQVAKLAYLGATDMEIADFFEVDVRTINRWKITHPEFCQSLREGKEEADAKVVRSLFQRATGFEHDSVKVGFDKEGNPQYAPFREFVVPDTTAMIFWLKNRKPDIWRDRKETELTGPNGGAIQIVSTIPRPPKDE